MIWIDLSYGLLLNNRVEFENSWSDVLLSFLLIIVDAFTSPMVTDWINLLFNLCYGISLYLSNLLALKKFWQVEEKYFT